MSCSAPPAEAPGNWAKLYEGSSSHQAWLSAIGELWVLVMEVVQPDVGLKSWAAEILGEKEARGGMREYGPGSGSLCRAERLPICH